MIPEPQVETVVVSTATEWDAVEDAYNAKGWRIAATTNLPDGTTRLTFVPDQGEDQK